MSLINNRNEESAPEFEVISGGKEDVRSSFADRTEQEAEIDLIDLAWALLDKIHYIVLCFLIGAVIMNAYSYFLVRPTYKSTAKMYVVSASKNSVVDLDALNIGTSLTADYEQLMLSYPVLEQVINKLNLDEKTKQEDRYKKRCIYLYDKESGKLLTTFKTKNSDVFYLGYSHLILGGDSGEEFQLLSVEQLQEKNPDWKSLQLREE